MSQLIVTAAYDVVHRRLEDPNWTGALIKTIHRFNNGYFPDWYLSMLFQEGGYEHPFTIYEAYALFCLHSELGNGKILYAEVNLGEKPSSDQNHSEMNKMLSRLSPPFRGQFWGGTQTEDGDIYVYAPIELSVCTYKGQHKKGCFTGRFPLEVGSISIFKTLFYLNYGPKRLARWPYNSEKIYLLARS